MRRANNSKSSPTASNGKQPVTKQYNTCVAVGLFPLVCQGERSSRKRTHTNQKLRDEEEKRGAGEGVGMMKNK
jgi:hypothetical protein